MTGPYPTHDEGCPNCRAMKLMFDLVDLADERGDHDLYNALFEVGMKAGRKDPLGNEIAKRILEST